MNKTLTTLLAGSLTFALAAGLSAAEDLADNAATVLRLRGPVFYQEEGSDPEPVVEGQLFSEGDRLVTHEGGELELALADGSTMALGPNSEMTVKSLGSGAEGSQTLFVVWRGRLNAIVHKLSTGSAFEIETSSSVAAVKGTQFEVSAEEGAGVVTVHEGTVAVSDPQRRNTVMVPKFHQVRASQGAVQPARPLSREEAKEFTQRWAEAREVHAKRGLLLEKLKPGREQRRQALVLRQRARQERQKKVAPPAKPAEARKRAVDKPMPRPKPAKKARRHRTD